METEHRQVKVFLLNGPRHNTEMTMDRAYPVIQIPVQKHMPVYNEKMEAQEPLTTYHVAKYTRLIRSFETGLWIYEYKESA